MAAVIGAAPIPSPALDLGTFHEALRTLCSTVPVRAFPAPKSGVLTVRADDLVSKAVGMLFENRILSLPVLKATEGKEQEVLGIVDVLDVVRFLLHYSSTLPAGHDMLRHSSDYFRKLLSQKQLLSNASVDQLLRSQGTSDMVTLPDTCSLLEVMTALTQAHTRRVLILNSAGGIQNIITQSGLVKFLGKQDVLLSAILSRTVADLSAGTSSLLTVSSDDSLKTAFQMMVDNNVSAIPVLDETHHMISCITASDVHTLVTGTALITALDMPVRQFISVIHQQTDIHHPAVSVKSTDTVLYAIEKMLASQVHRLWLVDSHGTPSGVLSARDIICAFVGAARS